jgi:serine/threonine protein kinase
MKSPESPRRSASPPPAPPDPLFEQDKSTHPESALGTAEPASGGGSFISSSLKVGGTLAGYRLVKKLGEGGMGMVFAAEDIRLKRRVALKLMKPEVAVKEQHRQRFIREAQAAARVEHDHIVPIFQIGEDNGVPFIAMPFLKGEPLDVRLKRARLSIPEIVRIARQTAEGLAAAHEKGLIHRDIKPGNIWLETTSDGGYRVKILDFGLARFSSENQQLTQSGAVIGTPAYMAPEQARGRPVDHRAYLFSLGCILYEMTVGKRPFTGVDTMAILTALALDTPAEACIVNPAVPRPLSQLVMRLLEKDPTRRPASAREVAETIRKMQPENMVVVVAPAAPAEESNPWADIDAQSMTEVPPAESEPSVMSLSPDSEVDSKHGGSRSSTRKSEPARSSDPRSGYSSRSLRRVDTAHVTARAKWIIGGGLLAIAAIVAILIILAKNQQNSSQSSNQGQGNDQNQNPSRNPVAGSGENFAIQFNGKTSFVDVPTLRFQGGPHTVEAFITPASSAQGSDGLIVGLIRAGGIVIEQSGDSWQGAVLSDTGSANIQSAANTVNAGQRVHVAFVWNGTAGVLYVDGKKIQTSPGKPPYGFTNPGMTIGGYPRADGVLDRPFEGTLDEIRISKIARYEKDFRPQSRFESDRNTIALYHCDEGHGTALKDSSQNGYDGKVTGVKWVKPASATAKVPKSAPAITGNFALAFDGKTNYAVLPGLVRNEPGPVTLEAEQHSLAGVTDPGFQGKSATQVFIHEGLFCSAHLTADGSISDDFATAQAVTCPKWTHVAYVYDGMEGRIYVGGVLSQTLKRKIELVNDAPQFNYSQIGGGKWIKDQPTESFFDGEIRELRVSNTARYDRDFAPDKRFEPDISTVALYHLDDGQGDVLKDSSAGGHHGKVHGAKWVNADETSASAPNTRPLAGEFALRFDARAWAAIK